MILVASPSSMTPGQRFLTRRRHGLSISDKAYATIRHRNLDNPHITAPMPSKRDTTITRGPWSLDTVRAPCGANTAHRVFLYSGVCKLSRTLRPSPERLPLQQIPPPVSLASEQVTSPLMGERKSALAIASMLIALSSSCRPLPRLAF